MRCRACNRRLNKIEVHIKNPKTKQFEDMCLTCLRISKDYYDNLDGIIDINEADEDY